MYRQKVLGEIRKLFIYDKRLPKGNKSERLVSQFLELSVNPKGNLAYKYFLTMTEKKNLSVCACTHIPDTVCLRNEQKALALFYKIVSDFNSKWYIIDISKKGKTLHDAVHTILQKLIDLHN